MTYLTLRVGARVIGALLAGTALTACGGGGDNSAQDNPFFIGAEGGSTLSLPFATASSAWADADGESIIVPFVYATYDEATDATQLILAQERIDIPDGSFDNDYDDVTMTLNGDTIVFTDGTGRIGGQGDVTFSFWEDGDYASILNVYGDLPDGTEFDGMTVVGFQTDPSTIAALNDTVTYSGEFEGWGNYTTSDGSVGSSMSSLDGDFDMTVNFSASSVSGSLTPYDSSVFYYSDATGGAQNDVDSVFSFATDLTGNGFVGDLTLSCSTAGVTCDGGGTIGGAFFGPDAEETGGIATLEGTVTLDSDPATETTFSHPSAFFGSQTTPPEL